MKPVTIFRLLSAWLCCAIAAASMQAQPYRNPALSPEQRTADLLKRMTPEEKIAQIRHVHSWDIFNEQELDEAKLRELAGDVCWGFVEGFPLTGENCHRHMRRIQEYMMEHTRLKIPAFTVAEALHGSVHEGSAIYPQNIALASTFRPELAYRRAREISKELHYQGITQILAPCIDVVRDLRWGRVEESYGEDPMLNSAFACAEAKGYLESGISPMLKHYGAHGNPSGGLNLASVDCGIGELHDIYLQPFRKVITTLPVHAVMSAYNAWNRVPNSASRYLLTDILRKRWGFQGYVYSDWGAIDMLHTFHHTATGPEEAALQALSAGLDVEASSECYPRLLPLLKQGAMEGQLIDTAVARVLLAKFRMGLFEDPYRQQFPQSGLHPQESVKAAYDIAIESAVLLKNEGGLLPLDRSRFKSVAVIGPNADRVQFGDYSWSRSNRDGTTPLEGIRKAAASRGIQVNYSEGCDLATTDTSRIAHAVRTAKESDVALLFCGSASASLAREYKDATCGEGFDLSSLSLTGAQEELIRAVHATGKPTVLVLVTGRPFALAWEKEHIPAILVQWYAGEEEGNAIADLLFGRANPSGHLPVSFPQSSGHLPAYYNHLPTDKGFYHKPGSPEEPGRDYVFSSPRPLWAFGHGLSYTTFSYTNLEASVEADSVKASVLVRNTGKRSGKAVPQLYVRDLNSSVVTPVRQLKAFAKIELQPSEAARVPLHFAVSDLALTNEQGETRVEPGDFEIEIGDASDHILQTALITIGEPRSQTSPLPPRLSREKPHFQEETIGVSGIVRDVQATPVEGVSVYSTALQKQVATTDDHGRYAATASKDDILVFRKKGYMDEQVAVEGKRSIQVKMRSGAAPLR